MSSAGQGVLVAVPQRTFLGRLLGEELRAAGFAVEVVHRSREAFAAAAARPPSAIVTSEGFPGGWLVLLGRRPALAAIPVVAVSGLGKPRFIPFTHPVRWDAVVPPRDAMQPGVLAAAVRDAIARGRRPPAAGRERVGLWMCRAGSVLATAGFVLMLWRLARELGGSPSFVLTVSMMTTLAAAFTSGDVGTRLARGFRPGLGWTTWLFVVLALAGWVVLGVTGAAPVPR